MSTITLKNVPEDLHAALKSQARTHGRSLNKEILSVLQGRVSRSAQELIAEARAVREEASGVYLTQRELDEARQEGRA